MNVKLVIFIVILSSITFVGSTALSYSLEAGWFDSAFGVMVSQSMGNIYLSTGVSANKVAFLMNQRLGLTLQKDGNVGMSLSTGLDASFLFAYEGAKAILFSAFIEGGIEYRHFELTLGIFKGIKAINDSRQLVNFDGWAPEVKVGYRW